MSHRVQYWPGSVPSSGYGPRILVERDAPVEVHMAMRVLCKWGAHDNTVDQDGVIFHSYEFGEAEYAKARVVTEYYKLEGSLTDLPI